MSGTAEGYVSAAMGGGSSAAVSTQCATSFHRPTIRRCASYGLATWSGSQVGMATKSGKGAKHAKSSNQNATELGDLIKDGGGYDSGWPEVETVMANMELSKRLAAGGFLGCGFGLVPDGLPFVTLFGTNIRKMRSALALLKEWTTLSGPNAIRMEIVFDGRGYVLAISQQVDLLRWRACGVDTVRQPLMIVTNHIKRIDTRHPVLDQLARHAEQPVAAL